LTVTIISKNSITAVNAISREIGSKLLRCEGGLTCMMRDRRRETEEDMGDAEKDQKRTSRRLADELDEIALHCSRLPVQDPRTPAEILGFDEREVEPTQPSEGSENGLNRGS
jgi:hypothetical protein